MAIMMYGYEVIPPKDGKFDSGDDSEDDFFKEENGLECNEGSGDMFLHNSRFGAYVQNIHVHMRKHEDCKLPKYCDLTILLTDFIISEAETHSPYLQGNYHIFIGVKIKPHMSFTKIQHIFNKLFDMVSTDPILKQLKLENKPKFITGMDETDCI